MQQALTLKLSRARAALFAGAAIFCALSSAAAQNTVGSEDYRARQQSLTQLSEIFGELHHIRRLCAPRREADVWRERMKRLVNLEDPDAAQRNAMVEAFNKGYRTAQRQFIRCDRPAENRAADRAARGEALVASLAEPLRAR
ncbi:MAG: TIGR02301 family protein [Pseudomonadota bacterium]